LARAKDTLVGRHTRQQRGYALGRFGVEGSLKVILTELVIDGDSSRLSANVADSDIFPLDLRLVTKWLGHDFQDLRRYRRGHDETIWEHLRGWPTHAA